MKKKGLLILICGFYTINLFSQIPNGAKEIFHLKIEQENRFYISKCQAISLPDSSRWSNTLMTNGAMVELAFKSITLGVTFLTDHDRNGGTNKIDLDLGYEYNITKSIKLQPFIGYEFNENGKGISAGTKLNKNFDFFNNISLGVFIGCRYSRSKDFVYLGSYQFSSSDYISASIGAYCLIYSYKRPKIIREW